MLSELIQYQGKAGFFKLIFLTVQNTGKCELNQFLLRQSHMILLLFTITVQTPGSKGCTQLCQE